MDYQSKQSIFALAIHEVLKNGSIALKHSELLPEFLFISDGANGLSCGASAVPSPILHALLGAGASGYSLFGHLLVWLLGGGGVELFEIW